MGVDKKQVVWGVKSKGGRETVRKKAVGGRGFG